MKRVLRGLTMAVGLALLGFAPAASAQRHGGFHGGEGHGGGGGFHGGGRPGSGDHWGGFHRGFDGGGFHRGFGRDHFGFYFYGGFPFSYPYYDWSYPYSYDYYSYPYPDYGYYPPVYQSPGAAAIYPPNDTRSYLVLGHDSGKALRLQAVTWDWLVSYLRAYIVSAPAGARADFRRGFLDGYGAHAESVFDQAMAAAQQAPQPPPSPPQASAPPPASAPAPASPPPPASVPPSTINK